jgi:hypothetical protein
MFWLTFVSNWVLSFVFTFGVLFSASFLTLLGLKMPPWGDTVWTTALFYVLSSVLWLPPLGIILRKKPRKKILWAFWVAWLAPLIAAAITVYWAFQSVVLALVPHLAVVLVATLAGYLIVRLLISLAMASAVEKSSVE